MMTRQKKRSNQSSFCSETSASEPSLQMAGNATSISGNQMILLDSIFRYSRDNLALVNIYIKPPVVTRILRDQRYVTQNKIFSL